MSNCQKNGHYTIGFLLSEPMLDDELTTNIEVAPCKILNTAARPALPQGRFVGSGEEIIFFIPHVNIEKKKKKS